MKVSVALLITCWGGGCLSTPVQDQGPASAPSTTSPAPSDTVRVAVPTGDTQTDRSNVQAAFDAVQPGGTILFARGTYLLGAGAKLTVPDVTVLGHPEGTALRGCDPEVFEADRFDNLPLVFGCTGLYLQAERQTIRGLTFEYAWHGIVIGPFPATEEEAAALGERSQLPASYPAGGHRVEGNTFRATPNGLRVLGHGEEVSIVRDNDFVDVFHAIGIYGAPLHFLDNRLLVTEPGRVPFSGHTGSAIIVSPGQTRECARHVVAGNRIDGYPDAIYVVVRRDGTTCRGVEIRNNTIHGARVRIPRAWAGYTPTDDDSTMVGVPITLMNTTKPMPGMSGAGTEGVLEDILVQGNRILEAEGLAILVQSAGGSRIVGNTITGIDRREPFPGTTWDGFDARWAAGNGSAIWISPGSEGNEIVGNEFDDIASAAVVLEGDSNRVVLEDAGHVVEDLGADNHVTVGGAAANVGQSAFEERTVDLNGVRLRYLDFGGEGIPLVFTPALFLPVEEYVEIGTRLQDDYRVLVVGRRDEGGPVEWLGTRVHAEDLLGFLDALAIERAVLAGNTDPSFRMTYLAEEHPERVAGVIYLAGPPAAVATELMKDPRSGGPMLMRLWGAGSGHLEEEYHPFRYLEEADASVPVPALTFVNSSGTRGVEDDLVPLLFVGSPRVADDLRGMARSTDPQILHFVRLHEDEEFRDEQLARIEDPEVRSYFQRLATDDAMQEEVERFYTERVIPAYHANWTAFKRAFGEHLRVVELDVPVVTGYEYKAAPDLIEPHIRRFLDDLGVGHKSAVEPGTGAAEQGHEALNAYRANLERTLKELERQSF